MSSETYLNHPTFGLLNRLCQLDDKRELFTTLYAQRLFFIVEYEAQGLQIESLGRNEARMMVEKQLRLNRTQGDRQGYARLYKVHQQVFC
ncbi:MAG: DUF3539 family protein [Alkalinema sp. RL_2_19]|nr:DUF3539 family protein [Alkalinema sp. RL_2_19]